MLEVNNIILKTLPQTITFALEEDCVANDTTSDLTIPESSNSRFQINAREDLIFCGREIIKEVFFQLKNLAKFQNTNLEIEYLFADGDFVNKGNNILVGNGDTKLILAGERLILNLVQHLSSIATSTHNFVNALNNPKIKILDTRKTIPNLRELQKYAVLCGGGQNHRFNLSDLILIKDNHIQACGGVDEALQKIKKASIANIKIEIECDNFEQVKSAVKHSPDIIMLDNMNLNDLQKSIIEIRRANSNILIEVSGGVDLSNIRNYQNLDIDFISIGSLTSSIKSVDIGLDFL